MRVAQAFDIKVNLITVSKTESFGEGYTQASNRASKLMRRVGIDHEHRYKTGDPVMIIKMKQVIIILLLWVPQQKTLFLNFLLAVNL